MLKHMGAKAHWNDEGHPWNSFVQDDIQLFGVPFIFIIHHLSIVRQSENDKWAAAIYILLI